MAHIYRAEHEMLRRPVALKVLMQDVEPNTERLTCFLREARIAASIKHPNVVRVFDVGVEGAVPYLVMELLVGEDLEALLSHRGSLEEGELIDLILPIVAGLAAVHDAGVVHRDLEPANIFLSKGVNDEVVPKLLDFGISQSIGSAHVRHASKGDGSLGTAPYRSPEAMRGEDMTPASDQYSLGAVLFECTTGVEPLLADAVRVAAHEVASAPFGPISKQAIRPSPGLQAIIERAMSLDPSERFPDMRALGYELLQLAEQRTRTIWGPTFGTAAAIVAAPGACELELEDVVIPLTRVRPVRYGTPVWPWLVGSVSFVAAAAIWMERHRHAPVDVPALRAAIAFEWRALAAFDDLGSAPLPAPEVERVAEVQGTAALEPATAPVESEPPVRRDLDEKRDQHLDKVPEPRRNPHEPGGEGGLGTASNQTQAGFRPSPTPEVAEPTPRVPELPNSVIKPSPVWPTQSTSPAEPPDWIVDREHEGPRTGSPLPPVGTNDAPIFD
jgi:serine/threonine-protein kinase